MINLVPCHEALSFCFHLPQLTASYEAIVLCIRSVLYFLASSVIKGTSAPWIHAKNLASYVLAGGAPLVLITLSYFWQLGAATTSNSSRPIFYIFIFFYRYVEPTYVL